MPILAGYVKKFEEETEALIDRQLFHVQHINNIRFLLAFVYFGIFDSYIAGSVQVTNGLVLIL